METMTKKITRATFKSFVKKNREELFVLEKTRFDGMVDCVTECDRTPTKAKPSDLKCEEHTLGISGVWLVGRSADWFKAYEDEVFKGIAVSNSCGSCVVCVIK